MSARWPNLRQSDTTSSILTVTCGYLQWEARCMGIDKFFVGVFCGRAQWRLYGTSLAFKSRHLYPDRIRSFTEINMIF